jgi:hypothetical protein
VSPLITHSTCRAGASALNKSASRAAKKRAKWVLRGRKVSRFKIHSTLAQGRPATGFRPKSATRAETSAETEQRLCKICAFATKIFDSNKRFCWLKRPPWADVLDTCIRRVATSPNTGRRLAWHSVNSMGAEYFRQRAKDSGRSLIWRQEIVAHVDQTWSANLYLRRSWSSGE